LSDAEKRLHFAAKNGKYDEIRALAEDGTDMNCPDPHFVRELLIYGVHAWRAVDWMWPSHQPTDLL